MPASNPTSNFNETKGPRKRLVKSAPPRNADTGDRTRSAPVPDVGKVRMYANPGRPNNQRVMRAQQSSDRRAAQQRQARLVTEATKQRATTRAVQRLHVVPHPSPDAVDSTRSPAQVAHDRASVDTAVRTSREKALRKHEGGEWARAVGGAIKGTFGATYGPGGTMRNNVVNEREARQLRARGVRVRDLGPGEARDVGATQGVRTLGTTGLTRAAQAVGKGIAKDPGRAIPATLKGFKDMAFGAPAAIAKTIVDPKGTAKSLGKDYSRRYGGLNSPGGVDRMADRISKEGAAPEIADAVSIGVPVSKAADLVLGAAARSGRLGGTLAEAVSRARPALRTTGGVAKAQDRSKGLVVALRQTRRDTLARRAVARDVHTADSAAQKAAVKRAGGPGGAVVKGEVDAVVREAHNRGEIVPTRPSARPARRVVSGRRLARAQRGAYSAEKARALHSQRTEQRQEIHRGANRVLSGLNPDEQRAFKLAMQTGAVTPAAGAAAARRRIAIIQATRAAGKDTLNSDVDELATLNTIAADPARHFTPRLERAVTEEMHRGARVGEGDPALGKTKLERAETAESRRLAPQADTLGVRRRGQPIKDAIHAADQQVRATRRRRDKAILKRDAAATRRAAAEGYAQHGIERAKRAIDHQVAQAEHIAAQHATTAATWRSRAARARYPHTRTEYLAKATAADAREARARARVTALQAQKGTLQTGYRRAVQKARSAEANAQNEVDRQLAGLRAAGKNSRDLRKRKAKGGTLINPEPIPDFHRRIRAARPAGVDEPGFFPSVRREKTRFSPFTVGGARKVKADRGYTGKLFRAGREDNSITSYTQGIAKNIKRKYNWKLVSDTIVHHSMPWSRSGLKYGQIQDELARRGISEDSVRVVDMDAFDAGAATSGSVHGTLSSAMTEAGVDRAAQLEAGSGRLVVLPKAVAEEMLSDTKPSGFIGRGMDVVKGKSARIMLGLSPAWLQFQVGANAIQTLLGTKSLPHEWVYANLKWWHGLSEAEKRDLEPFVGIGAFHDSVEQVHMGAAAQGGMVNSYRAMKAHPFWHKPRGGAMRGASVSQLNPLDTLFRLDNAQNNFFRKAVLYNNLRRQAYDRMGRSMLDGQRAVDKILGKSGTDAKAMMNTLITEKASLEKAAQSVHDFLGDYMTYSSRERRILSRNIMFYGYLRWSLKFAFYTMPIKHPVMTSILGQLGGMNTREVRDLLGGDELPWALGKIYFTKGGKLQSIDLSRANPFLNAVTQAKIPEKGAIRGALLSAIGFLPPMYGAALDVAFGKSAYRDRPLKVDSESTARPNKQGQAMTDKQALGVFVKEMIELAAPIRALSKIRADGRPESDNSIPFVHERYTTYKDPKIRLDVKKSRDDLSTGGRILHEVFPVLPTPSRDPETAAKIRRAQGKKSRAVAGAAPVDPETQKLLDYYSGSGAAASSAPSDAELQTLIDTYGGG